MVIRLTPEKTFKGQELCQTLLEAYASGQCIKAKQVLSCSGFLTFVAYVIKQGQPYVRSLWQCAEVANVFAAWSAGRRRYNPNVKLTKRALQDLEWWSYVFTCEPSRPIQWAGGQAFLWHQRQPDFDMLRQLAWQENLVVVLHTDASGDVGWGVSSGDVWHQGTWPSSEMRQSINWKELKAYHYALDRLSDVLANKLIIVKMDNTCAVHYVNSGQGRIQDLSDLARSVRLKEIQLGCESVAVHLPGEANITADALSRMQVIAKDRDTHPHRAFRKKLFRYIQTRVGRFTLDGMADEFGSNSHCEDYRHPSEPLFEAQLDDHKTWICPPSDMVYLVLKFLRERLQRNRALDVVLLLPERPQAPWFWMLRDYHRVARFVSGSDLFREIVWRCDSWHVHKMPKVREPWIVLASQRGDKIKDCVSIDQAV